MQTIEQATSIDNILRSEYGIAIAMCCVSRHKYMLFNLSSLIECIETQLQIHVENDLSINHQNALR